MNTIIDIANKVFTPLINLGAAPLMTIVLTVIALFFKFLYNVIVFITELSLLIRITNNNFQKEP